MTTTLLNPTLARPLVVKISQRYYDHLFPFPNKSPAILFFYNLVNTATTLSRLKIIFVGVPAHYLLLLRPISKREKQLIGPAVRSLKVF